VAFVVELLEPRGDRKTMNEPSTDGEPTLLKIPSSAKCNRQFAADVREAHVL
jgi:hypothetical protein